MTELTLHKYWIKSDGDGTKCVLCADTIYLKMYTFHFTLGNENLGMQETKRKLCERCYDKLQDNNSIPQPG